jgi:type IV pilus assembly protein PilW
MHIQQRLNVCPSKLTVRQKGFSLVELMIALVLSSILLVGLFQIFNSNRQAFSLQDGMARVQESGRISMEFLSRQLRVAGYMGCATGGFSSNFTNHVDGTKYTDGEFQSALNAFDGDNGISGFDNITAANIVGTTLADIGLSVGTGAGQIIAGSDAVVMQGVRACPGGKVVVGGTGTAQLKIADASACGLQQNDIVIVSNCNTAEAFGITNNPISGGNKDTLTHGSNVNVNNKLTGTYDDDSYIFKPSFTAFYIGNGASGEPALYMKSLEYSGLATAFGAFEISEGVEDMQLVYGEDTNGDGTANRYVDATNVGDFNDVISVRSCLLARSQDRANSESQTYRDCNGNDIAAGDNRMRFAYNTTNAIRNRLK